MTVHDTELRPLVDEDGQDVTPSQITSIAVKEVIFCCIRVILKVNKYNVYEYIQYSTFIHLPIFEVTERHNSNQILISITDGYLSSKRSLYLKMHE